MSKTFKALQRAAREREKPGAAEDIKSRPLAGNTDHPVPTAGDLSESLETETSHLAVADCEPRSRLATILEQHFAGTAVRSSVRIYDDGRMAGKMDKRLAEQLLERYSLLHCLRLKNGEWLWLLGNNKVARDKAAEYEALLDREALQTL